MVQNFTIKTNRLLIMPLTLPQLKKHFESPAEFAGEMGLAPSQSLNDAETNEAILNQLLPNLENPENDPLFYTMWIVVEQNKKAIIGGICFHGAPDSNGEIEIGYGIDEKFRNQGYMTETIGGIVEWLKRNQKAKTVKAETDISNISSVKVLEKNGFKLITKDEMLVLKLEL